MGPGAAIRLRVNDALRGIGCIKTVYFEIEVDSATLRADAKERMASTTAADVGFAAKFREPMWSATWIERVVRGTSRLLGSAGVSDSEPGVRPAASMRQRGVCRQPSSFRSGNPCCGGARAKGLNNGVADSARRSM